LLAFPQSHRYNAAMPLKLSAHAKYLFIGDSITDAGRGDDKAEGIGHGYARLIRDYLLAKDSTHAPQVINRGVSGNKIHDLKTRWPTDVIELKPDVLSVMIGINDVWHGLNPAWRPGVEIGPYTEVYRELLAQVRKALPACAIVVCEPTVISPPAHEDGNTPLRPYVNAVHALAREIEAEGLVRLHDVFLDADRARPDVKWTTDGVHPSSTGHMLIARQWLVGTGLL
jgi:lysophospholipase L1-like esterase